MGVTCPKCAFDTADGQAECPRCGVILARARNPTVAPHPAAPAAPFAARLGDVLGLDAEGRRALALGAAIAAVVLAVPFLRFIFSPLSTLVHEIGHTAVSWLFGYPSIPSFDFVHGGGWSLRSERNAGVVLLLVAAGAAAGWTWRRNRRTLAVLGIAGAAWLALGLSRWHESVIAFMGHGGELVFAGLFLYRGLSGRSCRIAAERPLYFAFGSVTLLHVVGFSWSLATSGTARAAYREGKGGVLADLHDIALDLHGRLGLAVDVSDLAVLLLSACALPPLGAWLWHRHRDAIHAWLAGLLRRDGA